ncbi:MAG: hypothetical protein HY340_01890 [Candidatus Kerfeldbacteria bacterium]|nr:hypothetical protein [Candidatus Kerfeldbacteria bacterium]
METLTVRLLNPAEQNLLDRVTRAVEKQGDATFLTYGVAWLSVGMVLMGWVAVSTFRIITHRPSPDGPTPMLVVSLFLALIAGYLLARYVLFRRRQEWCARELREAAHDPYLQPLMRKLAEHQAALKVLADSGVGAGLLVGDERPKTIKKYFPVPVPSV